MGGSGLVAVAEVVVYLGYLRKVDEAKAKGKKHVERKEIIKTWVLGGDEKRLLEKKEPRRIDNPENRSITKRTGRKG
jgi:predicted glycosyltransferase